MCHNALLSPECSEKTIDSSQPRYSMEKKSSGEKSSVSNMVEKHKLISFWSFTMPVSIVKTLRNPKLIFLIVFNFLTLVVHNIC